MVCRIHGVNSCDEVSNKPTTKVLGFLIATISHSNEVTHEWRELFKLIISCVISGTKIVVLSLQDFTAMNMSESRY